MNVPRIALYSTPLIVAGTIFLGVLVALKILDDCARRNGWT